MEVVLICFSLLLVADIIWLGYIRYKQHKRLKRSETMYHISKTFTFEAAHRLHLMQEGHGCKNIHGHSYSITTTLCCSKLDDKGMVLDFRDFSRIKNFIDTNLDHAMLIAETDTPLLSLMESINNKFCVVNAKQTTCELMAPWIYSRIKEIENNNFKIYSITISETAKTSATYIVPRG